MKFHDIDVIHERLAKILYEIGAAHKVIEGLIKLTLDVDQDSETAVTKFYLTVFSPVLQTECLRVRRLVDTDPRSHSLYQLLKYMEKNYQGTVTLDKIESSSMMANNQSREIIIQTKKEYKNYKVQNFLAIQSKMCVENNDISKIKTHVNKFYAHIDSSQNKHLSAGIYPSLLKSLYLIEIIATRTGWLLEIELDSDSFETLREFHELLMEDYNMFIGIINSDKKRLLSRYSCM